MCNNGLTLLKLENEKLYNAWEALGGISCVYDLWTQLRVGGRRQQGGVGRR